MSKKANDVRAENEPTTPRLTDKQKMFVAKYLGEAELNGAKAARLAGYAPARAKITAFELLSQPHIRATIDDHLAAHQLSANELLYLLARQARGTVAPFIYGQETDQVDDDELTPSGKLDLRTPAARANVHLIKEVTQTVDTIGEAVVRTTTKIKLHDSQGAIVHLMRAAGLFDNKADQLLKTVDLTELTTDQLNRVAAGEDVFTVLMSRNEAHAQYDPATSPETSYLEIANAA